MPSSPLIGQVTSVLATAFVAGLWQGVVLMLLAAALLRLMPRASARLRHTLLFASFVVALLLPFLHRNGAGRAVSPSHALPVSPWIATAVALLWVAAAGARGLQLALAWKHLRAVRREATPIALEGTAAFAAGSRSARLCTSTAVDSPTILGFWSPALLLPVWMAPQLSGEELRQIALHECEHLRRRDDWLNLLLQFGLVLSPLNPGLVWLNRRIGVQRELACDDAVVAATGQPITYASCLARLAEQRLQQRSHLRLALAAWERKSELAQRVHTLLQQTSRWTPRQSGLASAAAALLLAAASTGLSRVPQMVRIVDTPAHDAVGMATVEMVPASSIAIAPARALPVSMLPVSFLARPATLPLRRRAKVRGVRARHRLLLQTTAGMSVPALRRAAGTPGDGAIHNASFEDEVPLRLVTAEFSSPYVAVPTANGWLLIQL